MPEAHDEASSVCSENGHVIIDGPSAVAVTLTPAAADETAHRLIEHAAQAQVQVLTGQVR